MLHDQIHAACPCPCCMSMSILHVHVHTACPCPYCMPCPCCMFMSMLHFMSILHSMSVLHSMSMLHVHVYVHVHIYGNAGMPDHPASGQSGTRLKKLKIPGQVRYQNKKTQSCIFYSGTGLKFGLVSSMPIPSCEVHFFRPLMSSYLSQSSQGTILESK